MIRRIWTYVSDDTFYNLIQRARVEKCFTDETGKVDIGALMAKLVETYGDGTYIVFDPKRIKKDHSERFNPIAEPSKGFVSHSICTDTSQLEGAIVTSTDSLPKPKRKKAEKKAV